MLSSFGTERQSFASLFVDRIQLVEESPAFIRPIDKFVDVAIVIPVYNGLEVINEFCDRLLIAASRITQDFLIVLVDDRGQDNVWPAVVALGERDDRIHGIQLSRNFGQHSALTAGIDHVRARWYVVMDCDLQDLPEDIEKLFTKALDGYDVVVGTHDKAGHLAIKRQSSRVFYWLFSSISGVDLDWSVGNYRIFSHKVAESFRNMREEERFLPAAFSWMGFEVGKVQIEHHARKAGSSSYSTGRLFRLASNILIAYSELPLRIVTMFGFVMSVIAIILAAVYFFKALISGTQVVGWTSIVVGLFVLGSIQIFMLGVVGIYVGKTFREAKKRPLYLVRSYSGTGWSRNFSGKV